MSYFVESVLKIKKTLKRYATHYAITNGGKLRYLVALNSKQAKARLSGNLSTYSGKLKMLMKFLPYLPFGILSVGGMGEYVSVRVVEEVDNVIKRLGCSSWNVIVGNYVEKQKIVLQCFNNDEKAPAKYVKIGGQSSETEMLNEIAYLQAPIKSETFINPNILYSQKREDGFEFNIQVTEEFSGASVEPIMNDEVFQVYRTIEDSKPTIQEDGVTKTFSHGDFTPWNMKKTADSKYIIFDWEYSGYRFYGFDLIHYFWQVENKLHGKEPEIATQVAIIEAKKWDVQLRNTNNKSLAELYFHELHKQFGETL